MRKGHIRLEKWKERLPCNKPLRSLGWLVIFLECESMIWEPQRWRRKEKIGKLSSIKTLRITLFPLVKERLDQ